MNPKLRAALKRMKNPRQRARRRQGDPLVRIEEALARIELAILVRGSAANVQRAFDDLLSIYGLTGQMAEVVTSQRDQILALAQAYERLSLSLTQHHNGSTTERREIINLMGRLEMLIVPWIELARKQVAQLDNLERMAGMSAAERARLSDARHEEQSGRDG